MTRPCSGMSCVFTNIKLVYGFCVLAQVSCSVMRQDRCKGIVIVLTDIADCACPAATCMQDKAKNMLFSPDDILA